MSSSDESMPHLPDELERKIFRKAAFIYPDEIPNLVRVAARVYEWVDPLRYYVLKLNESPDSCANFRLLRRAMRSKPADFLRRSVCHLLANPWLLASAMNEVLPYCSSLHSLVLPMGNSKTLLQLHAAGAAPRRLALDLYDIFPGSEVDMSGPVFSKLTHLHIFNPFYYSGTALMWLAHLPTLTHLAVKGLHPASRSSAIFIQCKELRVLVSMYDIDSFSNPRLRADAAVEDVRFVMMMALSTDDYAADWEAGIRGKMDFWDRAEAFVAKKRRGEIKPESRTWVEEGDGIDF